MKINYRKKDKIVNQRVLKRFKKYATVLAAVIGISFFASNINDNV